MDNRTTEIQKQFFEQLEDEEKKLNEKVCWYAEQLRKEIAELEEAKKKLPDLEKRLGNKRALLDKLTAEIADLELEIGVADRLIATEGSPSFSRIEATKRDLNRATQQANSFVDSKIKEFIR